MNKLTLTGIIVAGIGYIIGLWLIHVGNAKEATTKSKELLSKLESQKRQISSLDSSNVSLKDQVDTLNEHAKKQKEELAELRGDNKKLNNKLINAQSEIISKFIGDDNYGVIGISGVLCGEQFCYQLNYQNISNGPIYDVQVRYYNVEKSEATKRYGMATIETHKLHIIKNIGNVTPNLLTHLTEPKQIAPEGEHYIFYIGARNGIYYQELFLFPHKERLITSISRMMKYNDKKRKFEELRSPYHHPDDFPIKKDDVQWELDFGQ